ncbi:glycerophosphodiester phosphodiesterase [Bacillus solitudinis]|uniref:glycerophosphodiester phosphodiesterase n=1 Tax=Bacillus solitudinis TaxID=2014074 RepID=UPI000C23CB69|nr:glycerophosphodiester phosphodiesterase family protein [Bacillus solitudinis]
MIIIAHRGWSGKAPENTYAAFKLAIEEPMIQEVELDVHLTKDGIPVVIHDHTLERTTNGTGFVSDYTFKELRQLNAGSWFDEMYELETIPSLEEVLELFKSTTCRLVIELKQMAEYYPNLEQSVVDLIRKYNMYSQVTVSSFDHESVRKVKELDESVETGLIYLGRTTLLLEQIHYTRAANISMHYAFVTEELVDTMVCEGIKMGVWTVDEDYIIERLTGYHPNLRVTTNYPDRLMKLVQF